MVSFSCEACNDVLPKKKLDAHISYCWKASFTCLDCMQHFVGTEYRAHTSCISEAQKYQGALYRPDKDKGSSKSSKTTILSSSSSSKPRPESQHGNARQAYVEDAPDPDTVTVAVVDVPPHAPSPPRPGSGHALPRPPRPPRPPPAEPTSTESSVPAAATTAAVPPPSGPTVNVFDFLVNDDTPNASRTAIVSEETMRTGSVEELSPIITEISPRSLQAVAQRNQSRDTFGESQYAETGFHYGHGPVPAGPVVQHHGRHPYLTPASQQHLDRAMTRTTRGGESSPDGQHGHERTKARKRKRVQVEELHLQRMMHPLEREDDAIMTDAPPVLHSGLTGGLSRLISHPAAEYPPSPPDFFSGDEGPPPAGPSPGSPIKRSKRHSLVRIPMTAVVPARRPSNSNTHPRRPHHHSSHTGAATAAAGETQPHQLLRPHQHQHHQTSSSHRGARRRGDDQDDRNDRPSPPARKLKTIKYLPDHHHHQREDENGRGGSRVNSKAMVTTSSTAGNNNRPGPNHHLFRGRGGGSGSGGGGNGQLVIYRSRADLFMSFVNKGPESEMGCSVNKALKRYHRELGTTTNASTSSNGNGGASGIGRNEEEKELWKGLRLRRNERGEVVLFADDRA